MYELLYFFKGVSVGTLVLLMFYVGLKYSSYHSKRLFLIFLLGIIGYVLVPLNPVPYLTNLSVLLAISVPASFCLLSIHIFDDEHLLSSQHFKLGIASIVLVYLISSATHFLLPRQIDAPNLLPSETVFSAIYIVGLLSKLLLIVIALSLIVRQRHLDLLEERRQLRTIVLGVGGTYMVAVIIVETWFSNATIPDELELLHNVILSLFLASTAVWFVIINPESLLEDKALKHYDKKVKESNDGSRDQTNLSLTELKWLEELQMEMELNNAFLESELTIGMLASRLAIPEHLLRKLINKHLGFRNFNDYLNQFRITKAALKLEDPDMERVSILTIAFDVGYASITPFNRAFKAHFNETPSNYRKRKLYSEST